MPVKFNGIRQAKRQIWRSFAAKFKYPPAKESTNFGKNLDLTLKSKFLFTLDLRHLR